MRVSPDQITIPYAQRNVWKAKVVQKNGWVEKDYRNTPWLYRIYGGISLHLEAVGLRRLRGIEGVPVYLGRPTGHLLRMTMVPGVPLDRLKAGELSELCFH